MESLEVIGALKYPKVLINYWRQRENDLVQLIDDFTFPAFERALTVLREGRIPAVDNLNQEMASTNELLKEAKDHVRFLGTLEESLDLIATTTNFDQFIENIPSVAVSLRNIWLLSKCFCSDEKIHGLIMMISRLINQRVIETIKLPEFETPTEMKLTVEQCIKILETWRKSFLKVRLDIEESRKEERWEFEINDLFADTDHITVICKDMLIICKILIELKNSFLPEIKDITLRPKYIEIAIQKIKTITEGLYSIKFQPFEIKTNHHWGTLMSWFQREIVFLEAESGKVIEETFDYLISSDLAAKKLRYLKTLPLREKIRVRYMRKVNSIIEKFSNEIDEASETFDSNEKNPPIASNLPPISGSIFWSQEISLRLKSTLNELEGVEEILAFKTWKGVKEKLDTVLKKLENYEVGKYTDWSNRVSGILDQNLGKNLIKLSENDNSIGRFVVNFTADLSDTFAEVINMEKIGFKVPEVAKNMSMQESKLIDISEQLQRMLDHYHAVVDSLENADKELLLENLKATEASLRPGLIRLTWNSLGISDYIDQSEIAICRTESIIRQVITIKEKVEQKIQHIYSARIFEKFLQQTGNGLKLFEEFHNMIVSAENEDITKLIDYYEDICPLLMKVEEILVNSRTKSHPRMKHYFAFWEGQIYDAIKNMVKVNLDDFQTLIESKVPLFSVEVILQNQSVCISPSEQVILKGIVTIIKNLLDGSKKFIRWARGTCIPVPPVRVKDNIRPIQPSFYDDIIRLPEIIENVEVVQNSIVTTLENIQQYLSSWKKLKNLWKFDKKNTCDKFLERSPSCVDFDAKLLYYSLLERQIREREIISNFKCAQLSLTPIKDTLLNETQDWINCLGKLLEKTAKEELVRIQSQLETLNNCLVYPRNGNELEKVLAAIASIWKISLSVEISYREIEEKYRTLNMYGIQIEPAQINSARSLPSFWDKIFRKSKEVYFRVSPLKKRHTEITKLLIKKFHKEANDLYDIFKKAGPSSIGSDLEKGLVLLKKFQIDFDSTCTRAQELNSQEKLYVLPLTNFRVLKTMKQDLNTLEEIYQSYQSYNKMEIKWKMLSWKKLDLDINDKDVQAVETELNDLATKFSNLAPIGEIQKRVHTTRHLFKILKKLKESKLRTRHWDEMAKICNVVIEEDVNFNIDKLWEFNLEQLESSVDCLIDQATNERKIESELQEIKEIWESLKFIVQKESWCEGGESYPVLGDVTVILDNLLTHQGMLDHMVKSVYSTHFAVDIEYWKTSLTMIEKVVNEWIAVQDIWRNVSKALSVKGFRETLKDINEFEDISKRYTRIMVETAKKPTVKDICLSQGFLTTMEVINRDLQDFKDNLKNSFEIKRKQFPRFFFLSDEDLITVLGGNMRDKNIQKLISNLFQHISDINADESGNIEVLFTEEQEDLPLMKSVSTENCAMEVWLNNLVEEIKVSMKLMARLAFKNCKLNNDLFFQCLAETPNVLAIAVFEKLWTDEFVKAFEIPHEGEYQFAILESWKKHYYSCSDMLKKLLDMKDLTGAEKTKNCFYMSLIISKKDLIDSFLNTCLSSQQDFNWERLMKYFWNQENQSIEIKQGFLEMDYGYEFMGVNHLAINNQQSERVWFLINEIIRNHNIPYLSGISGCGKTTLIEDLGKKLGRGWRPIMICENLSTQSMIRYMRGVCESNLWGVIENINLLPPSMMSMVSSHFQTIKTAQTLHLREFSLDDKLTRMFPSVAFICTESKIKTSTELKAIPLSLKIIFRKVAVEMPNIEKLLGSIMRVSGLKHPVTMTKQLISCTNVISSLLKKPLVNKFHLYKVFTRKAVDLLKSQTDMLESQIFYAVIDDYYANLLSIDEYRIAKEVLKDFFKIEKDICLENNENNETNFSLVCKHLTDVQKENISTILKMLKWSKCVIVCGTPFSGKSKIVKTAIKLVKSDLIYQYLNPSSYDLATLLGSESKAGVLASLLSNENNEIILHVDGQCDERIAFPLTQMLDKSEFFNGGGMRYESSKDIKVIIETTDLALVSDSLKSRSLILNLKEDNDELSKMIIRERTSKFDEDSVADKIFQQTLLLYENLKNIRLSDVDRFLNRTNMKKLIEALNIFDCLYFEMKNLKLIEVLVFSFHFIFTSCENKDKKGDVANIIKSLVTSKKDIFGSVVVESLPVIHRQKMSLLQATELNMKISQSLLNANCPILIVGERFGKEIFEAVCNAYDNPSTKVCPVNYHTLSDASDLAQHIEANFIKRGKCELVPNRFRDVLIKASDLFTPIEKIDSSSISLLKDIAETKSFVFKEQICNISDINTICNISPKSKYFNGAKTFNNFTCIYIEDNLDETVSMFERKMKEKFGQKESDTISKISGISKKLMSTSEQRYSSLSMILTTDTIINILVKLQESSIPADELFPQFMFLLKENLISPKTDLTKKQEVVKWIQYCLEHAEIDFPPNYDIEMSFPPEYEIEIDTSDISPEISLTKQQYQQCQEICNFLKNRGNYLSLYGEYGYGKTMMLRVAAKTIGYEITEIRCLKDLDFQFENQKLLVIRDSYISAENMNQWLHFLTEDSQHKVVFLMSTKSDFLLPWQQWILSNTQIIGIPYWSQESLLHVIRTSKFNETIKSVMIDIHKKIIKHSSETNIKTFPVCITSNDFIGFVQGVENEYNLILQKNQTHLEEVKKVLAWMKNRKNIIVESSRKLKANENQLEEYKSKLKNLKINLKKLEDEKTKLTADFDEESQFNKEMKCKESDLVEKYESIKTASFGPFKSAYEDIENLSSEELAAFMKPILVHEDIEKMLNILMILIHFDTSGWKPIKDKFLSQDWQTILDEFDPDTCRHKQEFVINKMLADIKTSNEDMQKLSPISCLLKNYILGALAAFKTKFERDKFKAEITEVKKSIHQSENKIKQLETKILLMGNDIKQNENNFQKTKEFHQTLEKNTAEITKNLKIEEKFANMSKFLEDKYEEEFKHSSKDDMEIFSNTVMDQLNSVYMSKFAAEARPVILEDCAKTVFEYGGTELNIKEILSRLSIENIGTHFLDALKLLTVKKVVYCFDPNDICKLFISCNDKVKTIKLITEDDLDDIFSSLNDEEMDFILIEDAYFENKAIMNRVLDEELNTIIKEANDKKKFVFFLTKQSDDILPHQAFSQLYFLNLQPSNTEVINVMISHFTKNSHKDLNQKLQELKEEEGILMKNIEKSKNKFLSIMGDKYEPITDDILQNLSNLRQQNDEMSQLRNKMAAMEETYQNKNVDLPRKAVPVIYGLHMLSRLELGPVPSFISFLEASMYAQSSAGTEDLMYEIYKRYSFQISQKGKVLFSTYMAIALLRIDDIITDQEVVKFDQILYDLGQVKQKSFKADVDQEDYRADLLNKYHLSEYTKKDETGWKNLITDGGFKSSQYLKYIECLVNVILDKDDINSALVKLVQESISDIYLKSATVYVSEVHKYSSPYRPIMFLLEASNEEPSSDLTKLADLQGIASSKVKYLALSRERVDLAMALLETAFIRGQWIIFQNVDLVPYFLPKLEKQINEKDKDDIHQDFRVWMTWCSTKFPLFTLLQKSIILYCEPSRDIRFHETNFFYNVSKSDVADLNFCQNVLFLTLCYLQKVLISRQKYCALSWTNVPDFPNYLVQTAHVFFQSYFETSVDSYKAIQYSQLIEWTQVFII